MSWSELWERLSSLDPQHPLDMIRTMSANEAIAFVIFLVFTVAFFLWVAYLAIRR